MKAENDLLNNPHLLPSSIQDLLKEFESEDNTYEVCSGLETALSSFGYSISWGLDAEPFNLIKLLKE